MTTPPTPPTNLDSLLARSSAYILQTWLPTRGYSGAATTGPIPEITWGVGGNGVTGNPEYNKELAIRGAAMAAVSLAVPVFLNTRNVWDPERTQQRNAAARLLAAVLRQHKDAPFPQGNHQTWGGTWQSPMWAAWAGLTALIGWHDLIGEGQTHRQNVYSMLESEAEYVMSLPIEYWRMANGQPGTKRLDNGTTQFRTEDSAAEESQWRSMVLSVAAALMPMHGRAHIWEVQAGQLAVTSFAASGDGYDGYNVDSLYLVHNHSRVHPDYMTAVSMNAWHWMVRGLLNVGTSRAVLHNLIPVWDALQVADLDNAGTRAYEVGSAFTQFPTGTPSDWGWRRPHAYAVFDDIVRMVRLRLPQTLMAPISPEYWSAVHLADAGNMQFRATSSTHPYGAFKDSSVIPAEATYPEEEVFASSQLAFLRLCRHVYLQTGTGLLV